MRVVVYVLYSGSDLEGAGDGDRVGRDVCIKERLKGDEDRALLSSMRWLGGREIGKIINGVT